MYIGENGYATDPSIKDLVYEGINYALANDMYVIVDWHVHGPGDPTDPVYEDAFEFFDEISDYYKEHPKYHYILWELANEPSPNTSGGRGITNDEAGWVVVKQYAEPIVKMLREKGDNIILVGNPNWSQRPDLAADNPLDSHNIMYSVHFYTGTHNATNESYPEGTLSDERTNVMANAKYALDQGVAVFATEWGVSEANGDNGPYLNEADIWLNFLNENNISWMNWSLTNKNETSGSFIPFVLNESEATSFDPGEDQVWAIEELSLAGEYLRARIKGIEYQPIDRTPSEKFTELIWDFNDGTTQGFVQNSDSPIEVTLENENDSLKITGLDESNGISEEGFWENARISAENWESEIDIFGATSITMDVIVPEPTKIAIAAIPQSETFSWTNPAYNLIVEAENFVLQDDGLYKAVLTINTEASPNLENIASDSENSLLNNIILFVGTEDTDVIYLDNISISGDREVDIVPVEHAPEGEAIFPSDFENGTRQGWVWQGESGVRTGLTIEEADGSNALSWEFSFPENKPSDNWASAPRLDFWFEDLYRNNNELVSFDLYIDPAEEMATEGSIEINLIFQPESAGYWAESSDTFTIELENLRDQPLTDDGLYHYQVEIDITNIEVSNDTFLRNMVLIFADNESDFAGRVYMDNVKFDRTLETKVVDLEREVAELREELASSESLTTENIAELEEKINSLQIQLSNLENQLSTNDEHRQIVADLLLTVSTLKDEIRELRNIEEGTDIEDPDADETNVETPGAEEPGAEEPGAEEPGTEELGTDTQDLDAEEDESDLPDTGMATSNFVGIGLSIILLGIALALFNQKLSAKEK